MWGIGQDHGIKRVVPAGDAPFDDDVFCATARHRRGERIPPTSSSFHIRSIADLPHTGIRSFPQSSRKE
jgi:hypothetical protein